jgi:hypothetical protein
VAVRQGVLSGFISVGEFCVGCGLEEEKNVAGFFRPGKGAHTAKNSFLAVAECSKTPTVAEIVMPRYKEKYPLKINILNFCQSSLLMRIYYCFKTFLVYIIFCDP